MGNPASNNVSVPLVHKITDFYKNIYQTNKQINKRDRLGLGQKTENFCLEIMAWAVEAAYLPRSEKPPILKNLRIKVEIIKQLVRLTRDIESISDKKYLELEKQLIEISKMNNNWLNWAAAKESPG